MSNLLTLSKKKIKSWLIDYMFSHTGDTYQRGRYPKDKLELILSRLNLSEVNNVLDIGCNEGYISSGLAEKGKFCVALDAGPYFLNHILTDLGNVYGKQNPAYGVFPLTDKNINQLPDFDLVLLLSVHHQWIYSHDNDYGKNLVSRLIEKTNRYFVIEFAATAQKYGFEEPQFKDNDEESIKAYAESWLQDLNVSGSIEYIGKNIEGNANEPHRFIFLITK